MRLSPQHQSSTVAGTPIHLPFIAVRTSKNTVITHSTSKDRWVDISHKTLLISLVVRVNSCFFHQQTGTRFQLWPAVPDPWQHGSREADGNGVWIRNKHVLAEKPRNLQNNGVQEATSLSWRWCEHFPNTMLVVYRRFWFRNTTTAAREEGKRWDELLWNANEMSTRQQALYWSKCLTWTIPKLKGNVIAGSTLITAIAKIVEF